MNRSEYQKQYRQTHKRDRRGEKRRRQSRGQLKTEFVGIDGEGWDINGQHEYTMIVTSTPGDHLVTGQPLNTIECLEYLSGLPTRKGLVYVSYFFDYDVTMILRDITRNEPDTARKLFPSSREYVWWRGYGIKYKPHKSITIKRWTNDNSSRPVTIHDTQGFFQSSFVDALTKYNIGTESERNNILAMKQTRGSFTHDDTDRVLRYSHNECEMLVELMNHIRDMSADAHLSPYPYEGPGGLANSALRKHYGPTLHRQTIEKQPERLQQIAPWLMYGGRFETNVQGTINRPVHEYDISSAYPAELSTLPCMVHGRWVKTKREWSPWQLSLIEFKHQNNRVGGYNTLPIRTKTGTIIYPKTGTGFYWRHEYENTDARIVDQNETWTWKPDNCNCQPFEWVNALYNKRRAMENGRKGSGIALKLALNTLYGKCAQQNPTPGAYLNMIYASIVTSKTRRKVYDAMKTCEPRQCVMFATDAIFTIGEAPIPTGNNLGQFKHEAEYPDITIVQPGFYFSQGNPHFKTRGIGRSIIRQHATEISNAAKTGASYFAETTQFIGMRLALARNAPDTAGQWISDTREINTRVETKRYAGKTIDGIRYTTAIANPNGNNGHTYPMSRNLDKPRQTALDELLEDDGYL